MPRQTDAVAPRLVRKRIGEWDSWQHAAVLLRQEAHFVALHRAGQRSTAELFGVARSTVPDFGEPGAHVER